MCAKLYWSGILILGLILVLSFSGFIFEVLEKASNGEGDIHLNEMQIKGMEK